MNDWAEILAVSGPSAWQTAYRLLGNEADAADCVQDAFVTAVKMSRRQEVKSWPALLRQVVTNNALGRLRQRYRRRSRTDEAADLSAVPDAAPGPPEQAQAAELARRLRRAVASLPEQQAEVFCMRFLEDLTYDEIAEALELEVSNVGVLLHRARAALHQMLDETQSEAKSKVQHE